MRLPEDPELPFQINIVPMIDVVFAILTFFIMSSLYLTRSQGLPVNLPASGATSQQVQAPITVSLAIDPNGNLKMQVSLGNNPGTLVDWETLQTTVAPLIPPQQQTTVILNADARIPHGTVVAVMDRLRQIGGVKLAIATRPPQQSP
ncbi:MAG: biopolymer transporter ExbD [Synechococcales bacterium]|nr:biopolymer transporter ExbD [Synechococcales bacterium]